MSTPSELPIQELFRAHLKEVEFWRSVASVMQEELKVMVRHAHVPAKVEARAKSTGSVIGKAYRKPESYIDLRAFPDLAGARVLVPFDGDVALVAREVHNHPDLTVVSDDTKVRGVSELGYQARHIDVALAEGVSPARPEGFGDRPVQCEIQIQTLAQSLWANVSHQITYKREDLPDAVVSRVNRLVVLCELFDDEASASRRAALDSLDAASAIAAVLQRYFFGLTGELHDPDQAVSLVMKLVPAIEDDQLAGYEATLEAFVQDFAPRLQQLLGDDRETRDLHWLLRPEILLILERLTHAPFRLTQIWSSEFQLQDLERIEAAWGPTDPNLA